MNHVISPCSAISWSTTSRFTVFMSSVIACYLFRDKRTRWSEAVFATICTLNCPSPSRRVPRCWNLMKLLNIHVNEEYSCLSSHSEIEDFIAEQQHVPPDPFSPGTRRRAVALLAKVSASREQIANVEKALAGELVQYNKLPAYLLDVSVRSQTRQGHGIEFIGSLQS